MKAAIALTAVLVIFPSTWLRAQLPPAGNQQDMENAAVKYLRADASLRQSYTLTPDAAANLQKALESPLDDEDEKLVAAADEALVEFDHGAASNRCNWEMSVEDGAVANTAHRGAIMELVSVSGLRARLRFRSGDTPGGMNDVLAAMTAARHLSIDGSLASVLFAYRLENALTGILARNLNRFSPEQLNRLAEGLDALPSGSNLASALEAEKVRRNDFLDIVQGAKNRDELIELLLKKIPVLRSDRTLAAQIVDGCGGSIDGFVTCAKQQHSFYVSWASRFGLPPEQFEREYKTEIGQVSRANPLIRQFTPALPRFRWVDAYSQTRRAMLQAAIAVRQDGPSGLNRHLDPYDRNSFSYIPLDSGFRLESRLKDGGIPISLSIAPNSEDRKVSLK